MAACRAALLLLLAAAAAGVSVAAADRGLASADRSGSSKKGKRREKTAMYVQGMFSYPYPNATTLAYLNSLADRVAATGSDVYLLCMMHVALDNSVYYNDVILAYSNGTLNPAFAYLPAVFARIKARSGGAQLLWSWGGWGSGYEYGSIPGSFANILTVLQWSGLEGIDMDPEPFDGDLSPYQAQMIELVWWLHGLGYDVTAAPYDDLQTWVNVLEATVDPRTAKPMVSRLHVQLYGNFLAMAEFRALLADAPWLQGRGALASYLWPGWGPCLSTKQPSYPADECGFVVGRYSPPANRMAAAAVAAAYGSPNAFAWDWQTIEGEPASLRSVYTCNQTASLYTAALLKGLSNPEPVSPGATMCAPLLMSAGQAFQMRALVQGATSYPGKGSTVQCATTLGQSLQCASAVRPTKLRAFPYAAWVRGRDSRARISMSEPLVLATGPRGKGAAFLTYDETQQLLVLTTDAAAVPADVQLVRATASSPPETQYPPGPVTRGPFLLRLGSIFGGRYCSGSPGGVTCPPPPPTLGAGPGSGPSRLVWNPRDALQVERAMQWVQDVTGAALLQGAAGTAQATVASGSFVPFNHFDLLLVH